MSTDINTELKQHPAIYPNAEDPKEVEKIVGEFNKYYTRLKRFYMVSKTETEKTINDIKIAEITRLKVILKYFLHRENIDCEAIKFVTQMIQEIHNLDYENQKKSKMIAKKKTPKVQNKTNNNNNKFKPQPQQHQPNNNSEYKYSKIRTSSFSSQNNSNQSFGPKSSNTVTSNSISNNNDTTKTSYPKKDKNKSSRYQSLMNFQKHNNKKRK